MSPSSGLALVIDLAVNTRDAIARQLATAQKLVNDAQAQLESLQRYHGEYLSRAGRQHERDAASMINFNAFIDRLEAAIEQQRAAVAHHRSRMAALKTDHLQAAVKVKSLEQLAAIRAAEERLAAERAERKLEDEHASRAGRHKIEI